jgi:hypothetical protein
MYLHVRWPLSRNVRTTASTREPQSTQQKNQIEMGPDTNILLLYVGV